MSQRSPEHLSLAAIASGPAVTRRTFIQGSAVALAALAAPALPTRAAGDGALVRFVNAAAQAPSLDLFSVDGTPVAEGLAVGKATKPARQPGGTFSLVVQPAGGEQNRPLLRKTLTLNDEATGAELDAALEEAGLPVD
jgi:hypothetical protein